MLEPLSKNIDGIDFQFLPMDPFKALELDKQTNTLLAPLLGGLALGGDDEVSVEGLARGVSLALQQQGNKEFVALFRDLFTTVTVVVPSQGAHPAGSPTGLSVFQGNLILMYKVAFEVMRYNKFLPFGLLQLGPGIMRTLTSSALMQKLQKSGLQSEKSES